jgi:hypothetical protein
MLRFRFENAPSRAGPSRALGVLHGLGRLAPGSDTPQGLDGWRPKQFFLGAAPVAAKPKRIELSELFIAYQNLEDPRSSINRLHPRVSVLSIVNSDFKTRRSIGLTLLHGGCIVLAPAVVSFGEFHSTECPSPSTRAGMFVNSVCPIARCLWYHQVLPLLQVDGHDSAFHGMTGVPSNYAKSGHWVAHSSCLSGRGLAAEV